MIGCGASLVPRCPGLLPVDRCECGLPGDKGALGGGSFQFGNSIPAASGRSLLRVGGAVRRRHPAGGSAQRAARRNELTGGYTSGGAQDLSATKPGLTSGAAGGACHGNARKARNLRPARARAGAAPQGIGSASAARPVLRRRTFARPLPVARTGGFRNALRGSATSSRPVWQRDAGPRPHGMPGTSSLLDCPPGSRMAPGRGFRGVMA